MGSDDAGSGEIDHAVCPLCGGGLAPLFGKTAGARTYAIVRCTACRFAFVNPTPSHRFIVDFYAHAGHGDYALPTAAAVLAAERDDPNTVIDAARIVGNLKAMTRGRSLLDVGCGYGLFALEARRQGFDIDAIEIAATERAIAGELLGFTPRAETLEAFAPGRTYDAIILSQVLEHAREPMQWLERVHALLAPGGVAAIALPNFASIFTDVLKARDPYVTPPAHLNYFGAGNLAQAAARCGLTVIKSETVTRLPKRAFTRRFGGRAGLLLHRLFALAAPALDVAGKGNMLNVYARRAK